MKRIEINLDHYYTHRHFIHGGQLESKFQKNVHINSDDSDTIQFDSVDFIIPNRFRSGIEFRKDYSYRVKGIIFSDCTFSGPQDVFNRNIINSSYHTHVTFKNCKLDSLIVQSFQSVHFDNCMIKKLSLDSNQEVMLLGNELEYLKLHHSRVNGPLHLTTNKLSTVWLSDLQTEDDLIFDKLNASIRLRNVQSKNASISITGCTLKNDSYFDKVTAKECSVRDCKEGSLKLSAIEFDTLKVYRNRCSFTIENSTLSNCKFNLNKDEKISLKNISIQNTLVFDKNSLEQIDFEKIDISKVSFTGNEGDLSIVKSTGDKFPDLKENTFDHIEITDIYQEHESWNIDLESCRQLLLSSLYLETLSVSAKAIEELILETSIADLSLKVEEVENFKLSHHKSHNSSQVQIKESDSIEIAKLISPIANIQLGLNNSFLIKDSETKLCFSANQCDDFLAFKVTNGQNSTFEIHKSKKLRFESFEARSLKVSGKEFNDIQVSKSYALLDINVVQADILSIDGHKQGVESNLDIDSLDSISVKSSEFTELELRTKRSESVDLTAIKTNKLRIQNSESNKVDLTDIDSSNLTLTDVKAEELVLTTSEIERNQKIYSCEFTKSTLESCIIQNYEFTEFSLEEFSSEKLEVINTHYKNLVIEACINFRLSIGEDRKVSSWFFDRVPENELEITNSKGIDSLTLLGPDSGEIMETRQKTSVIFKETTFGSVKLSQSILRLLSADNCDFDVVNFDNANCQEISFQSSKTNSLTLLKTSGKLALSQNSIKTALIEDSTLSLLTIEECKSEDLEFSIDSFKIRESKITEIDITNSNIASLSISKVQPQVMKLRDLKLQNLSLNNFERLSDAKGKFDLRSINKGSNIKAQTFEITESNLTGLSFNSCYFSTFKELSIKESKLDEIKCTATTWPPSVTSAEGDDKQFEIREACRQLKFAMANHHDKVSELQFHALEMNAYKGIIYTRWKEWRYWNDVLSLFAGSTNKFGLNWFRPIWLVFFTISFFYGGLIWSHYGIAPFTEGYMACWTPADYFQLYNPTHRLSQLNLTGKVSGLTATIDFFSKIASAFFIYQIVAAFRKFRRS